MDSRKRQTYQNGAKNLCTGTNLYLNCTLNAKLLVCRSLSIKRERMRALRRLYTIIVAYPICRSVWLRLSVGPESVLW